jgi:hypothetical protein
MQVVARWLRAHLGTARVWTPDSRPLPAVHWQVAFVATVTKKVVDVKVVETATMRWLRSWGASWNRIKVGAMKAQARVDWSLWRTYGACSWRIHRKATRKLNIRRTRVVLAVLAEEVAVRRQMMMNCLSTNENGSRTSGRTTNDCASSGWISQQYRHPHRDHLGPVLPGRRVLLSVRRED